MSLGKDLGGKGLLGRSPFLSKPLLFQEPPPSPSRRENRRRVPPMMLAVAAWRGRKFKLGTRTAIDHKKQKAITLASSLRRSEKRNAAIPVTSAIAAQPIKNAPPHTQFRPRRAVLTEILGVSRNAFPICSARTEVPGVRVVWRERGAFQGAPSPSKVFPIASSLRTTSTEKHRSAGCRRSQTTWSRCR